MKKDTTQSIKNFLINEIAQYEYYMQTEIQLTGFVSGKTFNTLSRLKKQLKKINHENNI
jgi:hypothetical protein